MQFRTRLTSLVSQALLAALIVIGFQTPLAHADTNLIANPSMETVNPANTKQPQGWTTGLWGGTKATFLYVDGGGHTGERDVQTKITTKGTGDAKWYFADVAVTPNTAYVFSDFYTSSVKSQVTIQYTMTDGSLMYADLGTPAASAGWTQFSASFTTPANVKTMTVFHLIQDVGTIQVDDYSLTAGTIAPPTFDFSLATDNSTQVAQGGSTTNSVIADLQVGTTQPVTFSTSGLPANVTASFSSPSCSPTCTSVLTLTAGATAPIGTSTVTVTGTAGALVHTSSFSLGVVASSTPPPPPPANIVPNPSFETVTPSNKNLPQSWQKDRWGNNTTTFTYNTNLGHTGTRSVTVAMSAYKTGDAKWDLITPQPVSPGDTYDFSDWYQSTEVSHVVIEFTLTDGTQYYIEMRTAPTSSGWSKYEQAFQVPYNAVSMRVFHLIEGVGSLTIDDASLVNTIPKGFARPILTLTYDNGQEDNINTAIPMMLADGIPATYCISTQYVDGIPYEMALVQQISNDGFEICSHAVDHDNGDMTKESISQVDYELSASQQYLQQLTGQPIHNFLTPFGDYNDTVVNEIKKYYRAHRTTDEGYNTVENFDQYRLLVQNMEPTTTLPQFESYLNEAKRTNSWLILVYHRVATSSLSDYDTPLQDFQPQLDAIKASGITVETMDQALDEVEPQVGINDGYHAYPPLASTTPGI